MKNNRAWGWLAAGVLALGANGFYQDGGAVWAHRAVNQVIAAVSDRTEGVIALAAGRADLFLSKGKTVRTRNRVAACPFASVAPRLRAKVVRPMREVERFESMSSREEAQLVRLETNRERIEARFSQLQFVPTDFSPVKIRLVCPRLNIKVPQINIPQTPTARIPEIHVDTFSAGPA